MSPSTLIPEYIQFPITNETHADFNSMDTTMPSTTAPPPTIMNSRLSQLEKDHPEISFVIPNQHVNQHIDKMMNFKHLLEQVGNTAYDTITTAEQHPPGHQSVLVDSLGQTITHEQISKTVVLDMTDLRHSALNGLERFFGDTDIHTIINYIWIGVVTSLIILSVTFIMFSCYFYRKFRTWKKCNKDIRAHLRIDTYSGCVAPCNSPANPETAYYQMESPPCYTIATGLPTYDEAVHRNHTNNQQQQQQQSPFTYGFKLIYPTLTAVHRKATNLLSSWEKCDRHEKERRVMKSYKRKPETQQLQPQHQQQTNILNDCATSSIALLTDCHNNSEAVSNATTTTTSTTAAAATATTNTTLHSALDATDHFYTNCSDYEISNLTDLTEIVTV